MKRILDNYFFKLSLCALLAFAGCYFITADTGLYASVPFIVICAFICGFIDFPFWYKTAFFVIFSIIYKGIYSNITSEIVIAAVVCTATAVLSMLAASLLKRKKKNAVAIVSAVILIIISFGTHYCVYGDIVRGIKADNAINNYIKENYSQDEFSSVSLVYDYKAGNFKAVLGIASDPTNADIAIAYKKGRLEDNYMRYAECKLMRNGTLELTDIIRAANSSARHEIYALSVKGFGSEPVSITDTVNHGDISYYIYITEDISPTLFRARAVKYINDLLDAGFSFDYITFIGGEKGERTYQLTLYPSRIYGSLDNALEKFDYIEFSKSYCDYKTE